MSKFFESAEISDICLLLRAHGEHYWLISRVLPVVHQLERRETLPDDELAAALAYLDVLWIEARSRAAETETAFSALRGAAAQHGSALRENAHRYHRAVLSMRRKLEERVKALLTVAGGDSAPPQPERPRPLSRPRPRRIVRPRRPAGHS